MRRRLDIRAQARAQFERTAEGSLGRVEIFKLPLFQANIRIQDRQPLLVISYLGVFQDQLLAQGHGRGKQPQGIFWMHEPGLDQREVDVAPGEAVAKYRPWGNSSTRR